jgi:branched-chain amino acid aminotransferase
MGLTIFLDGKFVDEADAKVSVFDHGFLYGDGVFEGTRAYNNRIFEFDQHIDRLYNSAKVLQLDIPMSKEEMKQAHVETLRRNNIREGYIRTVVSRGKGDLGLDPRKCPVATVVIIASQIKLYPEEFYQNGLKVVTVPTRRNIAEALNPMIKSLNYLNNIMAKMEANLAGVPEAIMLNHDGFVAECTGDNIFGITGTTLNTPPVFMGALDGITRRTVMNLAKSNGYNVTENAMTRYCLYTSDECFLTGTAAEVVPVVEIDGRKIGDGKPGKMTRHLIGLFREYANNSGHQIFED